MKVISACRHPKVSINWKRKQFKSRMKSSQTVHKARFFFENEVAKKQNFKYNSNYFLPREELWIFDIFRTVKTHTRIPKPKQMFFQSNHVSP
ncbi:eIF-2-alpha kinase [Trichinella pseudospiralis]